MAGTVSIEDRLAITDLTIAYCWAIDNNDYAALERVFMPDACAELGRTCDGVEAIKSRIAEALDPLDDSQHMVSNHQVTVDGDRGTCRCYLHAQHVRKNPGGGPNMIVAGRYEDEVVRTSEGWRIARRVLTVMWTEGNPAVTRGD